LSEQAKRETVVAPRGSYKRRKSRGQSLVEFVLILPVVLVILLGALDFGRAFMGWIVLNNAARVGANYASLNATAWDSPGNASRQATYASLVEDARTEAGVVLSGCETAAVPSPGFPNGFEIGDFAVVDLTCDFDPITPLIGEILTAGGGSLPVSARAVFPIRTGKVDSPPEPPTQVCKASFTYEADPEDTLTIQFTNTTPGGDGTFLWDFGDATADTLENPSHTYVSGGIKNVVLRVGGCTPFSFPGGVVVLDPPPSADPNESPSPSPEPTESIDLECTVPVFSDTKRNKAPDIWQAAHFTTPITFDPDPNGNWTVQGQSLVGGSSQPCNVSITLSPDPAP